MYRPRRVNTCVEKPELLSTCREKSQRCKQMTYTLLYYRHITSHEYLKHTAFTDLVYGWYGGATNWNHYFQFLSSHSSLSLLIHIAPPPSHHKKPLYHKVHYSHYYNGEGQGKEDVTVTLHCQVPRVQNTITWTTTNTASKLLPPTVFWGTLYGPTGLHHGL